MDLDFLKQPDFYHDKAWKRAFDLGLAVWRVSAEFTVPEKTPSEEMLKNKLRNLALDIITDLAPKKIFDNHPDEKVKLIFDAARKVEAMRAYLRVVQNLNLTRDINCQVLDKEYRELKEELLMEAAGLSAGKNFTKEPAGFAPRLSAKIPSMAPRTAVPAVMSNFGGRLDKILGLIRERKVAQLKDMMGHFPDFSEKTIRNDLKLLAQRNMIARLGNGAGSYYQSL